MKFALPSALLVAFLATSATLVNSSPVYYRDDGEIDWPRVITESNAPQSQLSSSGESSQCIVRGGSGSDLSENCWYLSDSPTQQDLIAAITAGPGGRGDHKALRWLLEQQPAIDVNANEGEALITALERQPIPNVETVRILLEAGADPNVRAGLPLTLVAKHGQRLTGLLLEHGADPKINGGEALMLAADVANYEVVSLLLSRGPLSKKSDALLSAQIQLHAINQALMANNPQLYIGPLEGMVSRHASPRDALLLIKFRLEKTIEALTSPHYSNDHLY